MPVAAPLPRRVNIYLDDDDQYRWYHEDGTSTDAAARTTVSALAAGNTAWRDFKLMEYRGQLIEAGEESKITDVHAHDEKQRLHRE